MGRDRARGGSGPAEPGRQAVPRWCDSGRVTGSVPRTRPHVVVVGGGIAGLTAALVLARSTQRPQVTVLEAGDRVGGKLRQELVAGVSVDVGAESMLALRPEAVELVESIGAGEELVAPVTTAASVWSRGRLSPLPRATLMGIPGDPVSTEGILTSAERERLAAEEEWPGAVVTEDVSVGEYVTARLGRAVVDRLVEPLLGGVYAGHADRLSLQATMPAVWTVAQSGGSLLDLAGRGRPGGSAGGQRPGGVAARPPFAGLRDGVGRLPALLAESLAQVGVVVRTGTIVRSVERAATRWSVTFGPTIAEEQLTADAVVLAVPPTPTRRLVAAHSPAAASALGEIESASSAVITLALPASDLDLPGSGFLVPTVEGRLVKASTFSSQKWGSSAAAAPGIAFVRASVGRHGEEASLQRDDDDLVDAAVAEIGAALGQPLPGVLDSHVQRWGGGLPQYLVGHVDRVARIRAGLEALPGLEVAGAAYDGVGIPAVVASARTAADAVLTHLTRAEPGGSAGGE